ncbi:MAG: tRNA lysidine(34) synthetase TilS, partial [Armatimonadaceae bacterium]
MPAVTVSGFPLPADLHPLVASLAGSARALGCDAPSSRTLLAVSGGPDSCALLIAWCAAADAGMLPRPAAVAHLNHGMRGDQAKADARWVRDLADSYGVPSEIGERPLAGANEAEARASRYDFLLECARRLDCRQIATGHTADDQAETVLMRVLRGTSPDGLAGIPQARELAPGIRVVRPMLGIRRSAIEAFVAAAGVEPRHDPTNDDMRYVRGRLRAAWGAWESGFNPQLGDALCRLAELAARDREWIGDMADAAWERVHREGNLLLSEFVSLPPALRSRIALRWIHAQVSAAHREAASTALHAQAVEEIAMGWRDEWTLPGALAVRVRGGLLSTGIDNDDRNRPGLEWSAILGVPGRIGLPDGRFLCVAPTPPEGAGRVWRTLPPQDGVWLVRGARPGDRVAPLGMGGRHRKVADTLRDAGISRGNRPGWPLVLCPVSQEVAWVVEGCVSESFRVSDGAGQVHWWLEE